MWVGTTKGLPLLGELIVGIRHVHLKNLIVRMKACDHDSGKTNCFQSIVLQIHASHAFCTWPITCMHASYLNLNDLTAA